SPLAPPPLVSSDTLPGDPQTGDPPSGHSRCSALVPADTRHVIHIGAVRPALLRAGRLVTETVLVPTLLLIVLLHTAGLAAGFGAVLGWCALTVALRWIRGRSLPGTLVVCTGMLCARACAALALSSAVVYLLQPIAGSILMALLFLGSA